MQKSRSQNSKEHEKEEVVKKEKEDKEEIDPNLSQTEVDMLELKNKICSAEQLRDQLQESYDLLVQEYKTTAITLKQAAVNPIKLEIIPVVEIVVKEEVDPTLIDILFTELFADLKHEVKIPIIEKKEEAIVILNDLIENKKVDLEETKKAIESLEKRIAMIKGELNSLFAVKGALILEKYSIELSKSDDHIRSVSE